MTDKQRKVLFVRTLLVITSATLTKNSLVAAKPIRKISYDRSQIHSVERELKYLQSHLEDDIIRDIRRLYERHNLTFLKSWPLSKKTSSMVRKLKSTKTLPKLLDKIDKFLKKHAFDLKQLMDYTIESEYAYVSGFMSERETIMTRLGIFLNLTIEECDDAVWPKKIEMGRHKSLVIVPARGGVGHLQEADLNFIKSLEYFLITAIGQLEQYL